MCQTIIHTILRDPDELNPRLLRDGSILAVKVISNVHTVVKTSLSKRVTCRQDVRDRLTGHLDVKHVTSDALRTSSLSSTDHASSFSSTTIAIETIAIVRDTELLTVLDVAAKLTVCICTVLHTDDCHPDVRLDLRPRDVALPRTDVDSGR